MKTVSFKDIVETSDVAWLEDGGQAPCNQLAHQGQSARYTLSGQWSNSVLHHLYDGSKIVWNKKKLHMYKLRLLICIFVNLFFQGVNLWPKVCVWQSAHLQKLPLPFLKLPSTSYLSFIANAQQNNHIC